MISGVLRLIKNLDVSLNILFKLFKQLLISTYKCLHYSVGGSFG